jgi:hypothetical protein
MTARRKRFAFATAIGVIAWWAMVLGEIYVKCRVPDSEACSWAHAFFPKLTVPLFFVIIGLPAFVIAYVIAGRLFRDDE